MSYELLRLILPLPPSINHQYATVKGKRVLSWEARSYKKRVIEGLQKASLKAGLFSRQTEAWREGYLCLSFDFYFRTPHRRDLDGGLKIAQDVICQAFRIKDNRVVQVCLSKWIDPARPRMEVALKALATWDFRPQEESHPTQQGGNSSGAGTLPLQQEAGSPFSSPSIQDGAPSGEAPDLTLDLLPRKSRTPGKGKAKKRPRSLEELAEDLGWE